MSEESKSWYRMTRPLFNSGFEDNEFWAYGQDGFQEVLDSFLGSDVLIYDKRISTSPQEVRAIVQNKTSDVFNSTTVRQILCNIGILKCGQYVKFEDAFWLVVTLPDNNRIYEKAVLWKCKHVIRFLSPLTGEVVAYPVFSTNSTQYGTGEAEKVHLTVGDDQHLIYLPYNEETIMLDNDFRFLMDKNREHPTAYRITRVDPVSFAVGEERAEDGLIQWAVLQDLFNEATDNKELMVADYFPVSAGDNEAQPGTEGTIKLETIDGDYMIAVGETKQIVVLAVLSDGTELKDFDYRVECDLAEGAVSVVDESDYIITLEAAEDRKHVGKNVVVKVISDSLNSEATMTLQIINW